MYATESYRLCAVSYPGISVAHGFTM